MPSQIGPYTILPIVIPATSSTKPTTHTIYLRPHTPKIPTPSSTRSLFLVNAPADSTSSHFRAVFAHLFGGAGKFESCTFEHEKRVDESTSLIPTSAATSTSTNNKKRKRGQGDTGRDVGGVDVQLPSTWDRDSRRSGSTAVVVLVDEKSVELVLKSIKKMHKLTSSSKKSKSKGEAESWPTWGASVPEKDKLTGSARYKLHHTLRFPSPTLLQSSVDEFITLFSAREDARAEAAKRARNEPDEDGFVTVTRGGRVGPARREEVERKRVELEEKETKKRGEMGDFYRFQMRERRKEEQGGMVRRFEEDRRTVERMRKVRGRFVPEK